MATMMLLGSSFRSLVFPAEGSRTSTPFWSIGVITMKMMSSTLMMSAVGVRLMLAIGPPLLPPTAIDMGICSCFGAGARRRAPADNERVYGLGALLDEVVEELGARVVHLDVEALDFAVEVVVRPDRGHRHEEAERGGDEGLRDAGRDGGDAAGPGEGHARERVDDAKGGAEEAHEGSGGADGREAGEAALEVGQVHRGGALDGPLGGVDRGVLVAVHLPRLMLVLPFLQAGPEHLGQVRVLDVGAVSGVDRLLDLALLQETRGLRRELPRLVGGLLEGPVALDHDRDRVHGHEEEHDDDGPRDAAHVLGHGPDIELHCASSWSLWFGTRPDGPG